MANNKFKKRLDELMTGENAVFSIEDRSKVSRCISKYIHQKDALGKPLKGSKHMKVNQNKPLKLIVVTRLENHGTRK